MTLTLRTASPASDASVAALLDACFERAGRESSLARALAQGCPTYDPGMALVAENARGPVGCALFLPREMRLRGTWVRCAIAAPFGVLPSARRAGVGRFLSAAGSQALRDRGIRAVVSLGHAAFFGSQGYAPAFDLHTVLARGEDLPEPGDTSTWRGLRAEDIPHLRELHFDNYDGVDGTERRTDAPLDFESSIPTAFTLVLPGRPWPSAYLRFRRGAALEVRECAARDAQGVDGILRFVHRLVREHGARVAEVHVPPPHPVARALHDLGNVSRRSNFRGAAMLRVLDWKGLIEDTSRSWAAALRRAGVDEVSLELGGETWRLERRGRNELRVSSGRSGVHRVHVPARLDPGLLTGMRSFRDLAWDDEFRSRSKLGAGGEDLLRHLFPGGAAMWTYSPVFELADD